MPEPRSVIKLSVLRRQRTIARNKLAEEDAAVHTHASATSENRMTLRQLLESVERRSVAIQALDHQIITHPDLREGDEEAEVDESAVHAERAHQCKARLASLLKEEESPTPLGSASGAAPSSPGLMAAGQPLPVPPPPVLTPALELDISPDVFSGDRLKYRLWRSQFSNWINRRTAATDADRLVVLSKYLSGPPKDLVGRLVINDVNYKVALQALDSNYGQVRLEKRQVLVNVFKVPPVRSPNDVIGLRQLIDHVQGSIMSMDGLGTPLADYALAFEENVRSALPLRVMVEFNDHKCTTATAAAAAASAVGQPETAPQEEEEEITAKAAAKRITELVGFLQNYTMVRERANMSCSQPQQQQLPHRQTPYQHSRNGGRGNGSKHQQRIDRPPPPRDGYSTAAPVVHHQQQTPWRKRLQPCFFCRDETHRMSRCTADLSYERRCQLLDAADRCRVCFRKKNQRHERCEGPNWPCSTCKDKGHYTAMHPPAGQTSAAVIQAAAPTSSAPSRSLVYMASAFVVYGGQLVPVRVFLDPGSTITFVTPSLIDRLAGIRPLHKAELKIQAFSSNHTITSHLYNLCVASTHDRAHRMNVFAYAHDFAVNPSTECPPAVLGAIKQFGETHPLADSTFSDGLPDAAPTLLVGVDQYYKIVFMKAPVPVADGLVAHETRLGWIVGGPLAAATTRAEVAHVYAVCCAATLSKPARDIERLWSTEAIGINKDESPSEMSAENEDAVRQFSESVKYDGSVYTVSMPKRPSIATLANNMRVAFDRLGSKRRSLLRDPRAYQRYDEEIKSFIREGHAEEVIGLDFSRPGAHDGSYYMPHHQVVSHVDDREKWRIVFDCSAHAPGQSSLNAHLLPGPNLNPDMVNLLINFRLHATAISADITRAYLMINLSETDGPLFRFLWQGPSDTSVRCYQMKKVTWGAAPSGFLLAATLRDIFKRVDPNSQHQLGGSVYHDDLLRSFASETEAIEFIKKVVPWLGSANMKLAKWKTNSPAVVEHLDGMGASAAGTCLVEGTILRVLGIAWSPAADQFRFRFSKLIQDVTGLQRVTKRSVLRVVASIFDPAGWLLPFTLRGKRLIQMLWAHNLRWDDPVPAPLLEAFHRWTTELSDLAALRLPRPYGSSDIPVSAYHLHIFGDASETAYAAAAYRQTHYEDGQSSCALVMAKSRLAPRDKISLPRLELLAALISTRLRAFLIDRLAIKVDRVFHYTDSTATYYWCTAEQPSRWKMFVSNRVIEVQELSNPHEWYHVSGPQNIADLATRGVSAGDLLSNQEWWSGPTWLSLPENYRPVQKLRNSESTDSSTVADELRNVVVPVVQPVAPLIDLDRFGSLERAVRLVARILGLVHRFRRLKQGLPAPAEAQLRRAAEHYLIKITQAAYFADEVAAVKSGERPLRKSPLASFALFVDEDGLLRAKTRLNQGPQFSFEEKNPIVLPGNSRLAALLILYQHRINAHFGVGVILSALRRRFWITRARQVIKTLLLKCVTCRLSHGPAASQVQAPLPRERISLIVPFATTGLDFCGPFYIRTREGTAKSYIALFTCASIRAVHLELVPKMTTPLTHLAIRRFLAANPGCRKFVTDNARTFVKAASDLKHLFNSMKDPEVRELLAQRRVEWTFNCPLAPWHGGFFERLVGTVKSALSKTLGRSLIGFEELRTIVCELAAVVNERPLTYVDADAAEPQPITPALFLRGGQPAPALCSAAPLDRLGPNGLSQAEAPLTENLRAALLERTNYFRALSVRWHREYMLQLRTANLDREGRQRTIKIGDVCLVRDDNSPRSKWNWVRILDAHAGRDGAVRTYSVRFVNGYESRRAAQLLYPLEVV